MDFLSAQWLWLYVGAFLMFAELMVPGFVIFFFGLAAAAVGMLLFVLPQNLQPTPAWQMALFTLFSIVFLVTLRRMVKSVFLGDRVASDPLRSEYVGRFCEVVSAIAPTAPGRVILGDAEWNAVADVELEVGARARVIGQDNLTLKVEAV